MKKSSNRRFFTKTSKLLRFLSFKPQTIDNQLTFDSASKSITQIAGERNYQDLVYKANNSSLKSSRHNNNSLQTNRIKDNIKEDSTHFYRRVRVIAPFSTRISSSSPHVATCGYTLLE